MAGLVVKTTKHGATNFFVCEWGICVFNWDIFICLIWRSPQQLVGCWFGEISRCWGSGNEYGDHYTLSKMHPTTTILMEIINKMTSVMDNYSSMDIHNPYEMNQIQFFLFSIFLFFFCCSLIYCFTITCYTFSKSEQMGN